MSQYETAVLLVNTGSPDAPTKPAVRRYLAQFLSDTRVIEMERWKWLPILHGIILRRRPSASAQRYRGIWTEKGSPLIEHTKNTAARLQEAFDGLDAGVKVFWAMCYGHVSVEEALGAIGNEGIKKVVVLPLYAQYAPQTTASVYDSLGRAMRNIRELPSLRTVRGYHDRPAYIEALRKRISLYWDKYGRPSEEGGKLLISFHGVPKSGIEKGDLYERSCYETAGLLARALGLSDSDWEVVFQSRFGSAEWLTPYAIDRVRELGKASLPRLDVVCPGFAADCLETIEEIGDELRREFIAAGGGKEGAGFHYIPALNDSDEAVDAYMDILGNELSGWVTLEKKRIVPI